MWEGYVFIVIFCFGMLSNRPRFTKILKGSFDEYASIRNFSMEEDTELAQISCLANRKVPCLLNLMNFFLHLTIFPNV